MKAWVYILVAVIVVVLLVALGVWLLFFMGEGGGGQTVPGQVTNVQVSRSTAQPFATTFSSPSQPGTTATGNPVWRVSWDPPSTGAGTGYTVTYSGDVKDSTGKTVSTFGPQPSTFITLPDTLSGSFTITVTATNQIGQGTPLTQTITLSNHAPSISGMTVTPASATLFHISAPGVYPDWPNGSSINSLPNYSFTPQVNLTSAGSYSTSAPTQSNGVMMFDVSVTPALVPGQGFSVQAQLCQYNLCSTGSVNYTVPGVVPGMVNNITPTFSA